MVLRPCLSELVRRRRATAVIFGIAIAALLLGVLTVSLVSRATATTERFPDVLPSHPYYEAITALASEGVIGGYSSGRFGPSDRVTRQQFAKMIVLAAGYPVSESDVCPFLDVTKTDSGRLYPDNYIAVCAAKGIAAGTSPTLFSPNVYITRYQVVTMVVRAADDLRPGLLATPPADWPGSATWAADGTHGANAERAERGGLLTGLDLAVLSPTGEMTRGEVAQVLFNLRGKVGTDTGTEETVARGGTLNLGITEPVAIDPLNLAEGEGVQVGQALFDSLVAIDALTSEALPAAAERWSVNDDLTVWTFTLVRGATFHDGTPVTASDFVYAWNRLCNPANGSTVAYHLAAVKGYDDVRAGKAEKLSGLATLDERTLQVTLSYPFADFIYVVSHPTLAPVPQAAVEEDPAAFAEAPVGNGPFAMSGTWQHQKSIHLVRFDGHKGAKPNVDGILFKIYANDDQAFTQFDKGNLDWSPTAGATDWCKAEFGVSDDGYTANPGKQTLLGPEMAIHYVTLNTQDAMLRNVDVRRAISLAINRRALCEAMGNETCVPVDTFIPPAMPGYQPGAWQYCTYDVAQARALLARAGYPNGQGLPPISLSCNSSGGFLVASAITEDLALIGIQVETEFSGWAAFLGKLTDHDYQIGTSAWIADYPIIDNFVFPNFSSKSADNFSALADASVDEALVKARQIKDERSRLVAYQTIVRTIGDSSPVIPLYTTCHEQVCSDRVHNLVCSALGLIDFTSLWLDQK
jgi:oligopeptide transport system substrate-binding protein